eukprot:TRINITY_DN673_c0_g2_i1.p1 TRINITY_DN673_c0_g2~~TRINITY_DN673_c0_g2_i1.p1  ORF type:complete len:372 (-),score=134.46 TRINITY_DN673_c0_g2_i1:28-1143(-)
MEEQEVHEACDEEDEEDEEDEGNEYSGILKEAMRQIKDAILGLDGELETMRQKWDGSVFGLLEERRKKNLWHWPLSFEELKLVNSCCLCGEPSCHPSAVHDGISVEEVVESLLEVEDGHYKDAAGGKQESAKSVGSFKQFGRMVERQLASQCFAFKGKDEYSNDVDRHEIQTFDEKSADDEDEDDQAGNESRQEDHHEVEEIDDRLDSRSIRFSALHVAESVRRVLENLIGLKEHLLHCCSFTATSAKGVSKLDARCDELPFLHAMKMAGIRGSIIHAVQERLQRELGFIFYEALEKRRGRSRVKEMDGDAVESADDDWRVMWKYLTEKGPKLKFPFVWDSSCKLGGMASLLEDEKILEMDPHASKRRKKS